MTERWRKKLEGLDEVIRIRAAGVLTKFQFVSTALTVTAKAEKTLWAAGVPILPLLLPGAALSPGTSNCNFTNPPAFTTVAPRLCLMSVFVHISRATVVGSR